MSAEMRAAGSGEICARIEGMAEWAGAGTVGFYAAQALEPNLGALLKGAGKRFCFPRVVGDTLGFHRCESMEVLRPGAWKILEPHPERCPVAPVEEIDLVFVPGLAFTRTGGRLGRGGGFYDRFLSGLRPGAVKAGVCFHAQWVAELPMEAHDHEVDVVVTEKDVFRCG